MTPRGGTRCAGDPGGESAISMILRPGAVFDDDDLHPRHDCRGGKKAALAGMRVDLTVISPRDSWYRDQ